MSQNHSETPCNEVAFHSPSASFLESSLLCEEADLSTRKPPFHLPPLDPSVFEKKGKISKPDGSRGKKKKCRNTRSAATSSSIDPCTEKREYNNASDSKTGDKTVETSERAECEQKDSFRNKNSLRGKKTPKKKIVGEPLSGSEIPVMDQSVHHENDDLRFQETLKKPPPVITVGGSTARTLRRSRSLNYIARSMEVLPSKKTTANTRSTSRFCSETSKERRRSSTSSFCDATPSEDVLPSVVNSAQVPRSSSFTEERRVPVRVQNAKSYACAIPVNHCNRRQVPITPIVSDPTLAVRFGIRRSSSQPDLSQSRNCEAPWRVRRVGMCRDTESAASMNERMQTRVLMKKFGTLNNPGQNN